MEIKSRVRTCDSAAWNSISTIKHGISLALPLMKLPKLLPRFSFLRRTPLQHQLIQTSVDILGMPCCTDYYAWYVTVRALVLV